MSDEKRYENSNKEGKTYVDGQPREIKSNKEKDDNAKNPLIWAMPIMIVILIVPLLIFHLGDDDHEDEGDDVATDESADEGDEGAEDEGEVATEEEDSEADTGDVDAEGIARDSCASCHGEDFSGGMGPALAGTDLADDEFHDIVREGQGSMPAFSEDQISDDEMTALYEFFNE